MTNFHQLTATSLDGRLISMDDYAGKVVLVVNTASQCGFTPQYAGLEALYTKYASQGLVVLGFPCNQFGKQEPGGADEISKTCYINYGVSFPMFEKVEVNGGALNAAQWVAASEDPQQALPKAIQVFTLLVNGLVKGVIPPEATA